MLKNFVFVESEDDSSNVLKKSPSSNEDQSEPDLDSEIILSDPDLP